MVKHPAALALSLVVAVAIACGRGASQHAAPDSLAAPTATAAGTIGPVDATTPSPMPKGSTCPPTGLWALCSVQKRLERAGFVLQKLPDTVAQPSGFRVRPTSYRLGHATLAVFLYPDARSLDKDWKQLDSATASPRGRPSAWSAPATLVRSANLAAVFLTESAEEAERLALALTAGEPQPATTTSDKTVLPAIQIAPRTRGPHSSSDSARSDLNGLPKVRKRFRWTGRR
jgi:hypothetical protein